MTNLGKIEIQAFSGATFPDGTRITLIYSNRGPYPRITARYGTGGQYYQWLEHPSRGLSAVDVMEKDCRSAMEDCSVAKGILDAGLPDQLRRKINDEIARAIQTIRG